MNVAGTWREGARRPGGPFGSPAGSADPAPARHYGRVRRAVESPPRARRAPASPIAARTVRRAPRPSRRGRIFPGAEQTAHWREAAISLEVKIFPLKVKIFASRCEMLPRRQTTFSLRPEIFMSCRRPEDHPDPSPPQFDRTPHPRAGRLLPTARTIHHRPPGTGRGVCRRWRNLYYNRPGTAPC